MFSAFYADFLSLSQISDYHHLKARKNTQMKNRGYNVTNVRNASTASAEILLQMSPIS